jgi:hypothetical protein
MVKLDVEIYDERLKFQALYEAFIDFDATFEELHKLGYCPKRYSAGRIQREDTGNLTFLLKSGTKVNVFPKGQPHKIQINWNDREDYKKQFCELTSVLIPLNGDKLNILPVRSLVHDRDEFLDRLADL